MSSSKRSANLEERMPFSAIALHADTSALTAIANDYCACEAYARQVRAHGRPGDVLLAFSTSGESENVLAAIEAAAAGGLTTWALTGPRGCSLSSAADASVCVEARATATIQEIHQVVVHLLCEALDRELSGVRVMRVEEVLG